MTKKARETKPRRAAESKAPAEHPLRDAIDRRRDQLQRLSDEIRLKIHLGGMDAKDAWKRLEPRLNEFERKAEVLTEELGKDIERLGATLETELEELRDRVSSREASSDGRSSKSKPTGSGRAST